MPTSKPSRLAAAAALLAAATGLGMAPAAVADPAPCTPYVLPGLPGGNGDGEVMSINDAGMYVGGSVGPDGNIHAIWWTHSGTDLTTGWTIHTVPTPPDNTEASDVNRYGVMNGVDYDTGQSWVYDSRSDAFTWLPELPGGSWTWGRRINASGEVSGGAGGKDGNERATVWMPPYATATKLPDAGASQSVGTKDGAHYKVLAEADGLNDSGTAVGVTSLGGSVQDTSYFARTHQWRGGLAPLYQAIEWHANGQVDRLPSGLTQAQGFAINNAGTAVGNADFAAEPNAWLAPAYWKDGRLHDMGAPQNVIFGIARSISQGGWVSGQLVLDDYTNRGFVWTGSGNLQPLPLLTGYTDGNTHAVSDTFGQLGGDMANETHYVPALWQCPAGFSTG